jgi:hypothetical protein
VSRSNRHLAKVRVEHLSGEGQTRILVRIIDEGDHRRILLPYGRRSGAASCLMIDIARIVSHSFVYFAGLVRIGVNRYHIGT